MTNNYFKKTFMEDMKLFQIGEVAKMFQVSVGTLRHYEQKVNAYLYIFAEVIQKQPVITRNYSTIFGNNT